MKPRPPGFEVNALPIKSGLGEFSLWPDIGSHNINQFSHMCVYSTSKSETIFTIDFDIHTFLEFFVIELRVYLNCVESQVYYKNKKTMIIRPLDVPLY